MINKLVFVIIIAAVASAFPTNIKTNLPEKTVAIIPANTDDLKTAETFYTGYSTGYPSLGFNSGPQGGFGWKGDNKPIVGQVYGAGFEVGYPGVPVGPVGSYGPYVPGTVVVGGGPVIAGGGGYGWRQGVNRWAL